MARPGGVLVCLRQMAALVVIGRLAALLTTNALLPPRPWRVPLPLRESAIDRDLP